MFYIKNLINETSEIFILYITILNVRYLNNIEELHKITQFKSSWTVEMLWYAIQRNNYAKC